MQKLILSCLAVVLLTLVAILIRNETRKMAMPSRIWSVYTKVANLPASQLQAVIGEVGPDWRELTQAEYRSLILPTNSSDQKLLLDFWGRPYHLSVRKRDSRLYFTLRCLGPDGKSNTADDFVIEAGKLHRP